MSLGSNGISGPALYMPPDDHALPPAPGEIDPRLPPTNAGALSQGASGIFSGQPDAEENQHEAPVFNDPPPRNRMPSFDFGPSAAIGPPLQSEPMSPPAHRAGGVPPMYTQAVGKLPQERAHLLGMSVVGLGVGSVVGYRYGGGYGALAGGLFVGAAINAYRAIHYFKQGGPSDDKEAQVSGFYALAGAAVGAYVWSKAQPRYASNPRDDDHDDDPVTANPCGIRPAGP